MRVVTSCATAARSGSSIGHNSFFYVLRCSVLSMVVDSHQACYASVVSEKARMRAGVCVSNICVDCAGETPRQRPHELVVRANQN
jgi:hypothetical protein